MPFCNNHNHIYFDTLCRTKKMETVLSLIHATDQAKKNCKGDSINEKISIAEHLVSAYQLFKFDAGSYSGTVDQFESQYTIGHELGIWMNSNLELSPLAQAVADCIITIRDYFDIVFLNYIQPVNNKTVHILASILEYAISNELSVLSKNDIAQSFPTIENKNEDINGIYNMLLGTSYFEKCDGGLKLNYSAKDILECCDVSQRNLDYELVKDKFSNLETYINYLQEDQRSNLIKINSNGKYMGNKVNVEIVRESIPDNLTIDELGEILTEMYNSADVKNAALHIFGVKYGEIVKKNHYTAQSIIRTTSLPESLHAELNKGFRIYDSIESNEFGVSFGNINSSYSADTKKLPEFTEREKNIHPLNQIIYGAPGTGKTYSTAEYAGAIIENISIDEFKEKNQERKKVMESYYNLINSGRVVFTTFHQSFGYEEFIQGLRPDVTNENMSFKLVDGVFKKIAEKALADQKNNYVIIIDEINRANISKVFGELITLIEEDKRWGEQNQMSVTLQSGDIFTIPNNLYIVGTMNSADKSISLIDAALRRRFAFIERIPDEKTIENAILRRVFKEINSKLVDELDSTDLLVGHSYFIGKTESELCSILNNNIIPLLYEYFYDNRKKVASLLSDVIAKTDIKIKIADEKYGRLRVIKVDQNDIKSV